MVSSAPFFFFFFFAVERSSLLTTGPTAGAANTGVRLVEPRKPSATIIDVNLRMMDILICLFTWQGVRLQRLRRREIGWLKPRRPPCHLCSIHDVARRFKQNRWKNPDF